MMRLAHHPNVLAVATAVATFSLLVFSASPSLAKGGTKPTPPPKPAPPPKSTPEPKPKDIVDTLTESTDPAFKSLLGALKAADLTTTLKGGGPFTLFAPTDDAFKALPEGKLAEWMKPENKAALQAVLNDHVVGSKLLKADLAKLKTVKTAGGHTLEVKLGDDKAWVGIMDSKATKTDVVARNGIIHFMDAVILKDAGGTAPSAPGASPARVYSAADLADVKALAAATLKALDAADGPGAAAKMTDLEKAWGSHESSLKPKDPATWTLLDTTLHKAVSALRGSKTDLASGKAALEDLVKQFEQATKS